MLSSPRKISKLFIKFLKWGKIDKTILLIQKYPDLILPYEKAFLESFDNKVLRSCKWIYEYCLEHHLELNIKNIINICIYACETRNWDFVKLIIDNNQSYNWKNIILDAIENKKLIEYNYVQLIKLNILE